ncbi:pentapeptide repeat-containing protein [Streptomyces sp. NPDC049837]|uniref:pentapeptide repeat-containing protein n=1 Tax=Streptomyces sp. NPDC049837 TaxID=3155277 RepID=UPI00343E7B06
MADRPGFQWHRLIWTILLVVCVSFAAFTIAPRVLAALGIAVLVVLLVFWVVVLPKRVAPPIPRHALERLGERDRWELTDARLKLQNELRTTALQAIAGLAVLAGAFLAFQQLLADGRQAASNRELTRQGQASERFTRSIDQLGSERTETRIGGVYGLEQIARQSPDSRLPVIEVLVAYLHRRAGRRPESTASPAPTPSPPRETGEYRIPEPELDPDVQAAATVIARRRTAPTDPHLDLSRLSLAWVDMPGAKLVDANLIFTNMRFADLRNSDMHSTVQNHLHPDYRVSLREANLSNAQLQGADLSGAGLARAKLKHANLQGANLRNAYLVGADLSGAHVEGADLRGAVADRATLWPDGFDWRRAGVTCPRC